MKNRKNQISLAVMLVLMGLTAFVVLKDQPVGELWQVIRGVKPGYLVLGLGLMLGFVGCEAAASRLALRAMGHKPTYRRCLGYSFSGFYFSSITPSATGGQPAQVYYMTKDSIPAAHGTLDMLLVTICYQIVTVTYAVAAWFVGGDMIARLGTGLGVLLGFGATTMAFLTGFMVLFLFRPNVAARLMNALVRLGGKCHLIKDPEKIRAGLDHQMEEYSRGTVLIRQKPLLLPAMLGCTFLQLTCLYLVPFVVYRAFGLHTAGAVAMVATQALVTLAVSCLPLPGSVGASEAAFVQAFALFFGTGLVTPAMLVSRSVTFYGFLLVAAGVTIYVHLRKGKNQAGEGSSLLPKLTLLPQKEAA